MKLLQSFQVKFLALISSLIIIVVLCLSFYSIKKMTRISSSVYQNQATQVVRAAQGIVDGDSFERYAASLDPNDFDYIETCRRLLKIRYEQHCTYLYTMILKDDKTGVFIADGSDEPDGDEFSPIGSEEDISDYGEDLVISYKTGELITGDLVYQPAWGWTVSAYAPIKNSAGNLVGIIGCDFSGATIAKELKKTRIALISFGVSITIIAIILTFFFTMPFFKRIKGVSSSLEQISDGAGDLTQSLPIKKDDEVGALARNFNKVIASLCQMIQSIKDSTFKLDMTSENLLVQIEGAKEAMLVAGSEIMDITTKTQAQTSFMNDVVVGISKTEEEIAELDRRLNSVSVSIENSSNAMKEMTVNVSNFNKGMNEIASSCTALVNNSEEGRVLQQEVVEKVSLVVEQARNLADANTAIANISSQTNLLAMNASIEAAHAGNAGKGFAVVAGEIRKLAESSAKQSESINNLLKDITDAINGIVSSSDASRKSFEGIGKQIQGIDQMIKDLQLGMNEQDTAIRGVAETTRIINETAQAINVSSSKMKQQSADAFGKIDLLKTQTNEIGSKVDNIVMKTMEVQSLITNVADASESNKQTATDVSELINKFKTM